MPQIKSLKTQVEELAEMLETKDIPEWPFNFITDMKAKLDSWKGDTRRFSEKQVDKIEQLHERYCK